MGQYFTRVGGAFVANMLAVYDFAESQVAFDFFTYLSLADLARRKAGSDKLCLLLVPSEGDGFNSQNVPYGFDQKRWRLRNIVIDGAGLLPSCAGVLQAASRDHARALMAAHDGPIYPPHYSLETPFDPEKPGYLTIKANYDEDVQVLRSSPQARLYAQQWLDARRGGRKAVALTLRESKYAGERNAALEPWIGLARYLEARGYFPFILRDIDTALDDLPPGFENIADCPAAVFNIDLRLALYELTYLNVFTFNGPMWLSALSRQTKFIGFPIGSVSAVNRYYEYTGAEYGETLPILNHLQRFIWHEPELPAMIEAFKAMEKRLAEHEAAGCPDKDRELDPANRRPAHVIAQHFLNVRMWQVLDALVVEAEIRGDNFPELYEIKKRANAERVHRAIDEELYERAFAFRSKGNEKDAIELLEKLVLHSPTEWEFYIELGMAYEAIGRIDDAETLYRTAISRRVASSYIVYRLGCIAQAQGNLGDAQACFELIVAKNEPGDDNVPHARRRLADVAALLAGAKPAN